MKRAHENRLKVRRWPWLDTSPLRSAASARSRMFLPVLVRRPAVARLCRRHPPEGSSSLLRRIGTTLLFLPVSSVPVPALASSTDAALPEASAAPSARGGGGPIPSAATAKPMESVMRRLAIAAVSLLLSPPRVFCVRPGRRRRACSPPQNWKDFSGIFGTFDRASLQRGFQVYEEVCSTCHSR